MAKISSHACYEVMLNYTCNARCMFCSQGNFDKARLGTFAQTARSIYLAKQQGYKRIGFTGGDPLVSPDILKAVTLAKKAGFPFIRVQTNENLHNVRPAAASFSQKSMSPRRIPFV